MAASAHRGGDSRPLLGVRRGAAAHGWRIAEPGRRPASTPLRSSPMQPAPFVTIRCPACGSADARPQGGDRYRCTHCNSNFLYTGQATPSPVVHAPARPGSAAPAIVGAVALLGSVAVVAFVLSSARGERTVSATSVPRDVAPHVATRPPVAAVAPPRPTVVAPPAAAPQPTPPTPTPPTPAPEPTPTPTPTPRTFADYQHLRGCECTGPGALALHVVSTGSTTSITGAGVEVERSYEFALASGPDDLWVLPTTADTAPATSYVPNEVTVGIGCRGTTVVVAAGETVSAWSTATREQLWSTRLPASFGTYGLRPGNDVILDCKRLKPGKDAVSVRAGSRNVRVALADGTLR